jgi:hypothetical protein
VDRRLPRRRSPADSSWQQRGRGGPVKPAQPENNVGFYPLYPQAARILATALHTPLLPTGIVLSLACLGAALLWRAISSSSGEARARPAGERRSLAFPDRLLLAAFYTESMFVLFAAAALWCASRALDPRRDRGGRGLLTRFNGFILVAALAACALDDLRRTGVKRQPQQVRCLGRRAAVSTLSLSFGGRML